MLHPAARAAVAAAWHHRLDMPAADVSAWVPLRWPCGPLELERGSRRAGFSQREADALRAWCEPRVLDALAAGPVSCLVLSWAAGSAKDREQQQALRPLLRAALARGLALVGWVDGDADLRGAAEAAESAGLHAIATPLAGRLDGFPLLRFRGRDLADRSHASFLGIADALWPGLKVEVKDGADASSGPTGAPWLDSNAWHVRLARALVAPEVLWLAFDPPDLGRALEGSAYVHAIADSAVYGGRFLLSLDPHLRLGLAEGRREASSTWAEIARGLSFGLRHSAWSGLRPVGQLGVVSSFAGENEFLSFEALNLLARLGALYEVLPLDEAARASLDGLDAVVYLDAARPGPALAAKLLAFAERGGTLVASPGLEVSGQAQASGDHPRFSVLARGRGKVAVSREPFDDPFVLAEDARVLMSHGRDRLRAFNPGVSQLHYATSADGARGIVHVLRYAAPDPRSPMTVWLREPWRSASAWGVTEPSPVAVARELARPGVELHVPPLPVYCALELEA
jgi:hypothetical protein